MPYIKKIIAGVCLLLSIGQHIPRPFYDTVFAQSPGTGIFTVYRDAAGGETIGTTGQALSWDTAVSEHAEIPMNGDNSSFDASIGGNYLVMYSAGVESTGGSNRSEIQTRINVNGSSIPYGYASSYIRRTDGDDNGYNEGAAILNLSPGDDISLEIQRTDTNTATVARSANRSGINILKLDDVWNNAQVGPTAAQSVPTTWTPINLDNLGDFDATGYTSGVSSLTLTEAGKYLVTYNVGVSIASDYRTSDDFRLALDGVEIDGTRSNAYIRGAQGTRNGIASYIGIIETSSVNQVLTLEMMRESSGEGSSHQTIPSQTGLTIVKLPVNAEYIRLGETSGGQPSTTSANTPITFDTTLESDTSFSHAGFSDVNILTDGDYLFFHSLYNARSDTSNGPREAPFIEWEVSGSEIAYGISGSYNRESNDGNGVMNTSSSSAGIILPNLTNSDTVRIVETNEATQNTATFQANRMGLQGVRIDSLFGTNPYIVQNSYRWRDDSSDLGVNGGWIAAENSGANGITKGETIRLRVGLENGSASNYDADTQFLLQWQKKSAGICGPGTWNDIGDSADDWEMVDTPHISPNGQTSANTLLSNPLGHSTLLSEGYHEVNGTTGLVSGGSFAASTRKEYEFSLRATSYALSGSEYCFRLYNTAESKTLDSYTYPQISLGSTSVYLDSIWGESGIMTAPADGAWTTLNYTGGPYNNPVIVGRINTRNDPNEAVVFEARNITSTSAEVRLCDSNAANSNGCQSHLAEDFGYIIVDANEVGSIPGIDAGTFSAAESFDTAAGTIVTSYSESFSNTPYVFTSVQSANGNGPVVTRVSASDLTSFTAGICEQEGNEDSCNASHVSETVGWIAVDPSLNPFVIDMDIGFGDSTSPSSTWTSVGFTTSFSSVPAVISQTVTNAGGQDAQIDEIQNVSTSGMEFRSCELDNDDDCDTHAVDTVRWLAIETGVFAQEYYLDETHYRWYENDATSLTPSVALSDENTPLNTIPISNQLRLRMLIQNGENTVPAGALSLKLQYANTTSCETATWTDVGNVGGSEDFIMFDNVLLSDGTTIPSSLLFGGGHTLSRYSESLATAGNPNPITSASWSEWDFAIQNNSGSSSIAYCFRAVTADDSEIQYSEYIRIDTTDTINPVISGYTPSNNSLLPIGNFNISYTYSDSESGIDTSRYNLIMQRWNGTIWDSDISSSHESLNNISSTGASFDITGLPYGRYRVGFEIYDNAGNFDNIVHELYVDEVEFTLSRAELDIGVLKNENTLYDSTDEITITVKTVGASFSVFMQEDTQLIEGIDNIPHWDGSEGYGYKMPPYTGNPLNSSTKQTLGSESRNLHPDGEKYSYEYRVKFSALLGEITDYIAGDYEGDYSFGIELDYE